MEASKYIGKILQSPVDNQVDIARLKVCRILRLLDCDNSYLCITII